MDGASGAMHFLKRRVGSGSNSHELAGETLTSRITPSGTSEVKSRSTLPSNEAMKNRRAVGVVGASIETRHAKRRRQRAAVSKDAQEDERRKDWCRDDGVEGGPDSGCSPTAESRVASNRRDCASQGYSCCPGIHQLVDGNREKFSGMVPRTPPIRKKKKT